jgi:uncharacterized protein YndB with AHSA1/START domain
VPDVLQDFPIRAPLERVFEAISSPEGLNQWWTERASGTAAQGAEYELSFGPEYLWRARVIRCVPNAEFELELTRADLDWTGTRVGFALKRRDTDTWLRFWHTGWPSQNDHYRISCHCWALYLRVLRRFLEHGETVPYEARLDV